MSVRYFATLEGRPEPIPVDLDSHADGRYRLTLEGETHLVDAWPLPNGAVSLLIDGRSFNVEFEDRGDEVAVLVNNHVSSIDVVDERQARLRALSSSFKVQGKQVMNAPMPG